MACVRVKICGITRVEDGLAAARAGADAIGLVFYAPSSRFVEADSARAIANAVGPFVTTVGLFVNAERDTIEQILHRVPLQLLQFHGDESPAFCAQFNRPYIKALRMRDGIDVAAEAERYSAAQGLLLDAYRPGVPGGTGERFDWQRVPAKLNLPLVLAGGLEADNVSRAVQTTQCYGVDVSGGVESAPGLKDPGQIKQFITNAKRGLLSK